MSQLIFGRLLQITETIDRKIDQDRAERRRYMRRLAKRFDKLEQLHGRVPLAERLAKLAALLLLPMLTLAITRSTELAAFVFRLAAKVLFAG